MRLQAFCFLALVGPALSAAQAEPGPALRIMRGDDPRWAAREWDDSDWTEVSTDELPGRAGIYWVRFRVTRPDHATMIFPSHGQIHLTGRENTANPINAVVMRSACSFELYWDGRLILRNGTVGSDRDSEVPGMLDAVAIIPNELLGPGGHVVAARISSFHFNFPGRKTFLFNFSMVNYDTDKTLHQLQSVFPLVAIGSSLVVAVICGILFWLVDRRRRFCCAVFLAWRWRFTTCWQVGAP